MEVVTMRIVYSSMLTTLISLMRPIQPCIDYRYMLLLQTCIWLYISQNSYSKDNCNMYTPYFFKISMKNIYCIQKMRNKTLF